MDFSDKLFNTINPENFEDNASLLNFLRRTVPIRETAFLRNFLYLN